MSLSLLNRINFSTLLKTTYKCQRIFQVCLKMITNCQFIFSVSLLFPFDSIPLFKQTGTCFAIPCCSLDFLLHRPHASGNNHTAHVRIYLKRPELVPPPLLLSSSEMSLKWMIHRSKNMGYTDFRHFWFVRWPKLLL